MEAKELEEEEIFEGKKVGISPETSVINEKVEVHVEFTVTKPVKNFHWEVKVMSAFLLFVIQRRFLLVSGWHCDEA